MKLFICLLVVGLLSGCINLTGVETSPDVDNIFVSFNPPPANCMYINTIDREDYESVEAVKMAAYDMSGNFIFIEKKKPVKEVKGTNAVAYMAYVMHVFDCLTLIKGN